MIEGLQQPGLTMSKKPNRMIAKTHTPGDPGNILDTLLERHNKIKWPNGGFGPATPLGFGVMGAGGMAGGFGSCDGSVGGGMAGESVKRPVDDESDDNEINYDEEIDFLGKSLKTDENADIVDALTRGAKVIVNNYITNNGKKNDVYIGKTKAKKCCGGDNCCHDGEHHHHHGHHHHCEDKEEWLQKHMKNFMDMIGTGNEDDQELSDAINAAINAIMEADAVNNTDTGMNGLVTMDLGQNTKPEEFDVHMSNINTLKNDNEDLRNAVEEGEKEAKDAEGGVEGTANVDQNNVDTGDMSPEKLKEIADLKERYNKDLEKTRDYANALRVDEKQ